MDLQQGAALINIAMAQDVGAKDHSKGVVGERKRVDRSGADRLAALGGCSSAGHQVDVEPEQCVIGVTRRQPGEKTAGSATCIQDPPLSSFERYRTPRKR